MLTSHCNNLSTYHYYLTYHPCFDMQFCHGQTTQQYFRADAISSRKKRKRSSCPFVPRRVVKGKKDWAYKIATSDKGSYYTQHKSEEVVPGNCVAVILWLYSSLLIMYTRKQFVLFPIQFIIILTQLLASRQALFPWGVSVSLESVVVV